MSLQNRTILIVEGGTNRFVSDLKEALERAGADVLIARDAATAQLYLERFDFSAALIGDIADPAEGYQALVRKLGGVPIRLCDAAEGVPVILRELTRMLGTDA